MRNTRKEASGGKSTAFCVKAAASLHSQDAFSPRFVDMFCELAHTSRLPRDNRRMADDNYIEEQKITVSRKSKQKFLKKLF
jgi:hypothetical protein